MNDRNIKRKIKREIGRERERWRKEHDKETRHFKMEIIKMYVNGMIYSTHRELNG